MVVHISISAAAAMPASRAFSEGILLEQSYAQAGLNLQVARN